MVSLFSSANVKVTCVYMCLGVNFLVGFWCYSIHCKEYTFISWARARVHIGICLLRNYTRIL